MVLGPGKEVGVHCCRGKGIQSESWDAGMLQAWGGGGLWGLFALILGVSWVSR